ncbi:response regulator transcription factor [Peptoniphilus phoceensis]|uniref:response regulator transcription factor n=1 Tax=Peptoniphilus phoceensis TaxID=1720298 RepID=UPI0007845CF1|nr:response regulator transcription factor [Peptoniphilus phoceensis]
MKILVVEDEEKLLQSIKEGLVHSGYLVDISSDGDEASFMAFSNDYDLIILDINLPGKNGFEILKEIRKRDSEVNIIMLTALSDIDDRVRGLDLGANDYIVKPFHFDELKARIRSLLRRKTSIRDSIIRSNGVEFDTVKRSFYIDKEPLKLTAKEAGILEYLFFNLGRYVTAEELMEHVWNDEVDLFSNVVRVHMSALRKKLKNKLGNNIIRNEIGKGYIIDDLDEKN